MPPIPTVTMAMPTGIHETPMAETFRGVVPFLLAELVRVGIVLAVPALVLTLPALLGR